MTVSHRSLLVLVALVLGISGGMQWWHGSQQGRLGEAIAQNARPGDIRMLSSDTCVACHGARQWMEAHKVPFTECSIERDAQCQALFRAVNAYGTPLLLVKGQPQLGFDPRRVLEQLRA